MRAAEVRDQLTYEQRKRLLRIDIGNTVGMDIREKAGADAMDALMARKLITARFHNVNEHPSAWSSHPYRYDFIRVTELGKAVIEEIIGDVQ